MVNLGNHVRLKRERENKHHENAVKVVQGKNKIGYLPRDLADSLSDEQIEVLNLEHGICVAYVGYDKKLVSHIDIHIKEK